MGDPRSVNLIMLGFSLSLAQQDDLDRPALHCNLDDVATVLENKLKGKKDLRLSSIRALKAGAQRTAAEKRNQ
jgi:hypothetical protein